MHIVIEHDNAIKGQRGVTTEYINNADELSLIYKRYKDSGITIYSITFCEETETP